MVTLVCVLVGVRGSAFPVDIALNKLVGHLKEAIVAEKPRTITCEADELKLFLAKKGDAWLDGAGAGAVTLDEHGHPQGFDEMDPTLRIENDRYFGDNFEPNEGEIHVLVVEPSHEVPAKRRRVVPPPPETVEPVLLPAVHDANYVTLPAALLGKCGLVAPRAADKMVLYCRREVRALWAFVQKETIEENATVIIVGPPGTGKSLATLCFVARLDPSEWNVVWIHFGWLKSSCLSMASGAYWKRIDDLSTFVVPRVAKTKLLVCLDGYKANEHLNFLSGTLGGLTKDERLLVCSAMATAGNLKEEDVELERIRVFSMHSWTLADYEAAVADAALYAQVVSKLDASSVVSAVHDDGDEDEQEEEEETSEAEKKKKKLALARKFYYAGGSCRFMFQRTTEQVKQTLQRAIGNISNPADLIVYCCGVWQHDAIKALYGMAGGGGGRFPVSAYAAALFAQASEAKTIALLAWRLHTSERSPADGPLLEWLLLASVWPTRAVKLVGADGATDELPIAPVLAFDPTKRFKKSDGRVKGNKCWLQPVVWNQGGYDAVYLDTDKRTVVFVQVARSATPSFNMRVFSDVLGKLKAANMTIETVEVYCVVKSAQYLKGTMDQMEDRGVLGEFDARWTQPQGNQVKVRAFEVINPW